MFSVKETDLTVIPISSPLYPDGLRGVSDAPETLYALGDVSLLNSRTFTMVGSRRTPMYALKTGKSIAEELSHAFTIVTGTADGGDGAAIEGALLGSGKVICVLAGGFSSVPQNQLPLLQQVVKRGLIVSLHSFETSVRAFSYEYRNKILAKMGEGVLVLGAAEKSGALITAKYAKQFEKPIFALPYNPGTAAGAGCNALIKQGGYLTERAADILEKFGIDQVEEKESITLSEDEQKIYQALRDAGDSHLTELAAKSGVPVYKIRAVLSALEVKGLAVSLGGNRYAPLK